MKLKFKADEDSISRQVPPNACAKCGGEKPGGVYLSSPVFISQGYGQPDVQVCYKAVCPICGDIKFYQGEAYPRAGIYKLIGSKADFEMKYWPDLRALNIDIDGFVRLLIDEPKRQYYTLEELPRRALTAQKMDYYESAHTANQLL